MASPAKTNLQARAAGIHRILKSLFPQVKTPLRHDSAFQLLVATILSAQSTDEQVNRVTPKLFRHFPTPAKLASARLSAIEALIKSIGLHRRKAKSIRDCARTLVRTYAGEVPRSLEALVQLPGVGRKTANVVLGAAFDVPGVVVDTHVKRVSRRLGLTAHTAPLAIELELMALIPESEWNEFCLRLIFFGRRTCAARRPDCPQCPLNSICPWPDKTT